MAINLQNLDQRFPIVDPETGQPTDYFMRLLRGQTGTLAVVTGDLETDLNNLLAREINTGFGLSGGGDLSTDRTISLGDPALVDPNNDRILFWDDSAGQLQWLTPGANLTITGTTLDASGGGGGGGGGVPTVVQFKGVATANISSGITLDAAPTAGNLLVAVVLNAVNTLPPPASGGWTVVGSNTTLPDHATFSRVAGIGESATQSPTSQADGGVIIMYEISGAAGAIEPGPTSSTAVTVDQALSGTAWALLAATSGLSLAWSGRRTAENGTLGGSFTNEVAVNGAAATTGGTGVSVVADTAIKNPGTSLPSASCTWPTSAATKTGLVIVY